MEKKMKIDGIPARPSLLTLAVKDLEKMEKFYTNLGWPKSSRSNENYIAYKTAGAILALWPEKNFKMNRSECKDKEFNGIMLAINVESSELVDRYLDVAREAGAKNIVDAQNTFWGGRSGGFEDPEGNIWEVTWADGTSFDERGALIYP